MTVVVNRKPLTSDRPVIILDCDGVLLKWQANLPHCFTPTTAMLDCIVDEKFRPATELFGIDCKDTALRVMREYNESIYASCLPAYLDALVNVNDPEVLKHYQLVMVSSFDSGYTSRDNRVTNLDNLFPGVFSAYVFAPLMADKIKAFEYVKREATKAGTFVEYVFDDQPRYLRDACTVFGDSVPVYVQRTEDYHPEWEGDTDILYGLVPLYYMKQSES